MLYTIWISSLGEDRKWCVRLYLVFYLFDTIMQILLVLKCFYVNNNYSLAFIIIFFLLAYSESCKAGEYIHQFISRFVSTTQKVHTHRHTHKYFVIKTSINVVVGNKYFRIVVAWRQVLIKLLSIYFGEQLF